jgi:hypothetical protein
VNVNFDEFCKKFRLGPWREENEYRRECERAIALHAVDHQQDVERLIHYWRIAANHGEMQYPDRRSFDQHASHVRQAAKGWKLLDPEEQDQFRTGALLPYRAAQIIRQRRSSRLRRQLSKS